MARIPEAELERLKAQANLAALVETSGVQLKAHGHHSGGGGDLIGRCPFHDDRTPSLVVSPGKGLWHCLGACQCGGSAIDWLMKVRKVSFRHAVELLREQVDGQLPEGLAGAEAAKGKNVGAVGSRTGVQLAGALDEGDGDQALLGRVVDYYHRRLQQSDEALAYLAKRGIGSDEAIDRFKIGYADRSLGLRLPGKQLKAGRAIRSRLEKLGLYRDSGHEHFNGCVVFPVINGDGHVTEIYGRKIGMHLRKGTALHLYLPGRHKGVWNLEGLLDSTDGQAILCESVIDALTFWCAGYRNVTCSYGIQGFTDDHLEALKKWSSSGDKRLLIAYDRDDAGEQAAQKLAKRLAGELPGVECHRVLFPKGMDANAYALSLTPAAKSLGLVLRKAQWLAGSQPQAVTPSPDQEATKEIIDASPNDLDLVEAELDDPPEVTPPPEVAPEAPPPSSSLAADSKQSKQSASPGAPQLQVKDQEIVMTLGNVQHGGRRYRVRGLQRNMSYDQLKLNILIGLGEGKTSGGRGGFYVDTFDLYAAKARQLFIREAAMELGIEPQTIKKDLGKLLLKLEELQEQQINEALKPKAAETVALNDADRQEALALLRDANLLDRILTDFEACGLVGEKTNKLVGYLAAVSRQLDQPLAILIQSSSAAGKSSLMEAVLAMLPPEQVTKYSAMTGQSLFYMGESDLKHKVLAIVEEEGAQQASYALKLLQSEGELTIASTGKDPQTGRLETQKYHVEGPVMIFLTTTAIEVDEELLNRCLVLTVDEDRGQTRKIHRLQRKAQTLEGLLTHRNRHRLLKLHRNAQRLLMPLLVANPYAEQLTFLDDKTRTRRDHLKYLTLIRSVALLHQYQRPRKTVEHPVGSGKQVEYIEVAPSDIEVANRLMHEVLGRSLDELPPHTRRLLKLLSQMVTEQCQQLKMDRCDYRFTRRELRDCVGFGDTQLKVHLSRLVELEYVLVHRGGRGQSFVYELLYSNQTPGNNGTPGSTAPGSPGKLSMPGLLDPRKLPRKLNATQNNGYDTNRSGLNDQRSAPGRPPVGGRSGGGRTLKNNVTALLSSTNRSLPTKPAPNARFGSQSPPVVVPMPPATSNQNNAAQLQLTSLAAK